MNNQISVSMLISNHMIIEEQKVYTTQMKKKM